MGKIVRGGAYSMEGQDRTLRLKKWSGAKFFMVVGELADVIDQAVEQARGADFTFEIFMAKLVVTLCRSAGKVAMVVRESLEEKVTDTEILEWDIEDILGVLDKSLEMNLTEGAQKKASSALGRLFQNQRLGATTNSRGAVSVS